MRKARAVRFLRRRPQLPPRRPVCLDVYGTRHSAARTGGTPMLKLFITLQAWMATRAREERGATAVEYGLMVALIAVVIIAAVTLLGTNLKALFNNIAGSV